MSQLNRGVGNYLPLALSGVALILYVALYRSLDMGAHSEAHYQRKLLWATAYFALLCVLLWHVVASLCMLRTLRPGLTRNWESGYYLLAVLGGCAAFLGCVPLAGPGGEQLIGAITSRSLPTVRRLTDLSNALAFVAITLSIATVHLAVSRVDELAMPAFAKRAKAYLLSLYSAASLLAAGLLEIYALFGWGEAHSCPTPQPGTTPMADSLAVAAGIVFTTLLVVIYGPAAVVHHVRLDALMRAEADSRSDFDAGKWLAAYGLKSSPLIVGTAMLLPPLTGIIATILKKAGQVHT